MQGQELSAVVDDVEQLSEALTESQKEEKKERKGINWDRILAYKSFKVVRIRDRHLGFTYWGIVLVVMLYVIVLCFSIGGKHQQQEPGVGTVLTEIYGKAYTKNGDAVKIFDKADIRFPVVEPAGAFMLTRKISVVQKRGKCVDWDLPKQCPCDAGETCVGDYCQVDTWCPSLGDKNVDNPPEGAVVDTIQGLENIVLKITSGIAFPGIGNQFFLTGGSHGATNQFQNITLKQLLRLADPPQQLDPKLLAHGALIGVSFFWNCDVAAECEPSVVIKRLDSGQGFVQKRARYYRQGDEEFREANHLNGLRILVDSSGIGRKYSLVLAIIQIGSAIALVRVAGIVADNFMLFSFSYSKTRRDAYYKVKVKETSDYSDLQDRINMIQATKSREVAKSSSMLKAGANVRFGLGAGGRGGSPASILHGR